MSYVPSFRYTAGRRIDMSAVSWVWLLVVSDFVVCDGKVRLLFCRWVLLSKVRFSSVDGPKSLGPRNGMVDFTCDLDWLTLHYYVKWRRLTSCDRRIPLDYRAAFFCWRTVFCWLPRVVGDIIVMGGRLFDFQLSVNCGVHSKPCGEVTVDAKPWLYTKTELHTPCVTFRDW